MLCCSNKQQNSPKRGEQVKHLWWRRYKIQFEGSVQLDRPLQPEQIAYLQRFLEIRRIAWSVDYIDALPDSLREAVGLPPGPEGAYFVGLSFEELKVDVWQPLVRDQKLHQNKPPQGQPRLWCAWKLDEDGVTFRYTDEQELYFCYAWLQYLIEHFFTPWGYEVDGEITWQGDDEADRGTIIVGKSHIEHQFLQAAGEKKLMWPDKPIACVHQDALETKLVCPHLADQGTDVDYVLWFPGQGRTYYLVCHDCAETIKRGNTLTALCQICWRCYNELEEWGCQDGIVGQPEVFVHSTSFSIVKQHKDIPLSERILDIQPVHTRQESVWIALTHEGNLVEMNLTTDIVTHLLHLPDSKLKLDEDVDLHVAPGGQYVAIANTHGQYGLVLDLEAGQVTMQLERDTYHIKHAHFPLAFFEDDQRLLLVHGTHWNRLDIADPRTGELLTERSFEVIPGQKRPKHYLDYFHGRLSVSPDQQWIVDDGWIWHPMGSVVAWNVRRWVQENPWESEDGSSLLELCQRDGYWDGPLCWIDERIVAVWGYGNDADWLIPAVRLFDVVAEKESGWFAGPEGTLVYDDYLFACSKQQGITAWDVATGERVLADTDFHPAHYHRGAKQFLHIDPQNDTIQVGTLVR
jgi:hypothetical protein